MPFADNSGSHLYETDALKNDRIFISHRHYVEDGFPNLEDMGDSYMWDEQDSSYSNLQKSEDKARTINSQVRKFFVCYIRDLSTIDDPEASRIRRSRDHIT
jgi:hypothetical protein